MARVWITRSQPAAHMSAARLEALGYQAIIAPLITISHVMPPPSMPHENAHLIFTSRNAVAAFARAHPSRHYSCICVGAATARAAQAAGFKAVTSVDGTADDVTTWVLANIDPNENIYHAAGNHPRGEIAERLTARGFTHARRETYYTSKPVSHDPRAQPFKDDIILLYSPMAAQGLVALELDLQHMTVISMSVAIDAALGQTPCKARHIAEFPTEDSLFAHLP